MAATPRRFTKYEEAGPYHSDEMEGESSRDNPPLEARYRLLVKHREAPAMVRIVFAMTGAHGVCGGIASANRNILHALSDVAACHRARFTVLSLLEKASDRPPYLAPEVKFNALDGHRWRFLAALLALARPGTLICFDHVALALPALPLAAAGLVQTVVFAHGSESWRRLRRTSSWSFRVASLCLTNSHFTLSQMRTRIPRIRVEPCPLGLPPEFRLRTEMPESRRVVVHLPAVDGRTRRLGERVLLLVGRADSREREKGHDVLIKVMPELLEPHPTVQLVLAGPGDDLPRLRALAAEHGVAASVFVPGFVDAETLERLYQCSYAFVMPSLQEGFGLAYLEAMNYGKPCVGCSDQGAEDIIVHGHTGLLVRDPRDGAELRESLFYLLDRPEIARALGRTGFERLHAGFTAHHYQRRVREKISSVLTPL
jgi:phosphatidylinositol alpha-1,6-mannosyltransferase